MEKPIRIKSTTKSTTDFFIFQEGEGMCCNGEIEICQGDFFDEERNSIRFNKSKLKELIKVLSGKIPIMTENNQKEFLKDMELYLIKNNAQGCFSKKYFE